MANIFDSAISDVQPAPGVQRAPIVRPQSVQRKPNPAADIINTLGSALEAGRSLFQTDDTGAIGRGVENAINQSFDRATAEPVDVDDILEGNEVSDINATLNQLGKLKEQARQGRGGDVTDRFNLQLMKKIKTLKARFPDKTGVINQALKARGFLDPRASFINQQAAIEDAAQAAEAKRDESILDTARTTGFTVFNTPGDVSSGEDKPATLQLMNNMAADDARYNQHLQNIGAFKSATGEIKNTLSKSYILSRAEIRTSIFNTAAIGMRPKVVEIQELLKTATLADLPAVKAKFGEIAQLADQFRLRYKQGSVALNPAEAKEQEVFVESIITDMTRGLSGVQDAKDLSSLKSLANALEWSSTHAQLLNASELPTVYRLGKLSPELQNSILDVAKLKSGRFTALGRKVGNELNLIVNMTPPVDKPTDVPVSTSEDGQGNEQKVERLVIGDGIQNSFVKNGIVAKNEAESYAWLMSQGPASEANSRDSLSPSDVRATAKKMLTTNYEANLNVALDHHPESAARIGSHAFDVVEKNLLNLSRELRSSDFIGRVGEDYTVSYNASEKQFEIKDTTPSAAGVRTTEGKARGRIKVGTQASNRFAQIPALATRLKIINDSLPFLLKTKTFKEGLEKTSEREFISIIENIVSQGDTLAKQPEQVSASLALIKQAEDRLKVSSRALLNVVSETDLEGVEASPDMISGIKRALVDLGRLEEKASDKKALQAFQLFKSEQSTE